MFRILIFAFLLFSNCLVFGQYFRPKNDIVQMVGMAGIGVGQENLVGLPKLSGFASFKLGRQSNSKFGNFQKSAFYIGSEASIVVLFAGAASISGTAGFKTGRFTTDCSLSRLWLANSDGDVVARQTTLNPKIGVMIGPVWIKTGPSFLLTNENVFRDLFGNFMHITNIPFNLELNYNFTW